MKRYNTDLYRVVAQRTGLDETEARRITLNVLAAIASWVARGDRVVLIGFGAFFRHWRPDGTFFGRFYPGRFKARFEASETFDDDLN